MKTKFLLLPLGLVASLAHAQTAPTITAADMPAAGDSLRLSLTAALPATAPPLTRNGANQTWNYAGLTAASQRVERYADLSTVTDFTLLFTFNNAFTGAANRATLVAPRNLPIPAGTTFPVPITNPQEFFNSSAADFRSVGYGATLNGTTLPVTYASRAQQDVIYRFPLTFGSAPEVINSLLTTPAVAASTGYFSQRRQRTNQVDGWGTLTTPFGTFQTVRVVSTLLDHDSLSVGGAPGQALDLPLTRQYKWLANGVRVPVLTITTTTVAGQETVAAAEYRDSYRRVVALASRGASGPDLGAAPNPSAVGTELRLLVPAGSGPLTVQATDLLGRTVFRRAFAGSAGGVLTLDAAAFGGFRGVLLLAVQTAQGTSTQRVVRE
ncbi:hypothetical protein [Hymenobacter bucti]|uniref:T9SS type A sorting domain-containing protein n=1 Tax=Hymenobacter bucti TaxID=1844114 RepID=A0ABW4QRD8_9BACT